MKVAIAGVQQRKLSAQGMRKRSAQGEQAVLPKGTHP